MRKRSMIVSLLLCALLLGCGCSNESSAQPSATEASTHTQTTTEQPTTAATEAAITTEATTELVTEQTLDPEARREQELEDSVEALLGQMTLEEKLAQLFVVTPEQLTEQELTLTQATDALRAAYDKIPVGGVILMGNNLASKEQIQGFTAELQQLSRDRSGLPLFVCIDEEGGTVARLSGRFGTPEIGDMCDVGAQGESAQAEEIGQTIGAYLSEFGFNVDFAPDADIWSNPENRVVKYRSFGQDPTLVTQMARAYAQGLSSEGILACYKHFPGHGATAEDSHEGFAISHRSMEELLESELLPFRDAAEQGIPFIMSGHILLPNASREAVPASLSEELLTQLLREQLGYRGLIITDALNMGAITQNYTQEEAAVLAIQAGNDMLLMPSSLSRSYQAVLDAVRQGRIPQARIDESVRRILRCKIGNLQN